MWVRVLGPSEVALGDDPASAVDVGARKPRSVLAALALRLGGDVPPDALIRLVWGPGAPPRALGTLHSYLSGVRRVLEPGLGPREKPQVLLTSDHGYRLALARSQVDAHHFGDEVRRRHRLLAPLTSQLTTGPGADWPTRQEVSQHVDALEELLGLWTGEAYADLPDVPEVLLERSSLAQLRLNAEEARVLGLLALGEHASVVAATEQATTRYPLQERVWALHALALTRSGRQVDALAALRHIRSVLADELGLDPGRELRDLEHSVLVQDPALQQWMRPALQIAAREVTPVRDTASVAGSAPPEGRVSAHPASVGWRMVGRQPEMAALAAVLEGAAAGTPAAGLLVGEPGIGKSRLVERLLATAVDRGFVVTTGRCSHDDGAPPLLPWSQALCELVAHDGGALDEEVEQLLGGAPADDGDGLERRAFRACERLSHEVTSRSVTRPVLLVLEDLHWADTATLKVLRHLLSTTGPGHHLAVVVTRRPWPEPTGALAEVGEQLARRHVTRLDLGGLSVDEARGLVRAVADTPIGQEVVAEWHTRSAGNPYFLVELARLGAAERSADTALPATVRYVLLLRLENLPAATRPLLLLAAVMGRRFSLDVLAIVADQHVEDVDEALTPAREAGLLQEPQVGVLAFTHALTRDAVTTTASPSRLARLHAQVAHALSDGDRVAGLVSPEERVAELARHWLAAGPTHVSRAWRAAADAAEQARRSFSWVEAERLVAAAIAAHRRDPLGTAQERIDLLLTRARDCRPNAEWDQVLPCAAEAMELARREGDLSRLAAAAAAATDNAVWLPQQWNELPEDSIDDLRWALSQLPHGDSPARCRVMVALSLLLYYDPAAHVEIRALAEEGVAMARRIGDPALLSWALLTAWKALWTPEHAGQRLVLAHEALQATRAAGDLDSEAVALVALTGSLIEMGDRDAYERAARATRRLASRRRNTYAQMALDWLDLSLASMRGDESAASRLVAELYEVRPRLNPANEALHVAGIQLVSRMWDERIAELVEPLTAAVAGADDGLGADVLLLALARTGDEGLRARLAGPLEHKGENWSSGTSWCCFAEGAAVAGDVAAAELMAARLAPLSGRIAVSGISTVMGPVDGYRALALGTVGRLAEATGAADRAEVQAADWGLTEYAAWLGRHRDRLGI